MLAKENARLAEQAASLAEENNRLADEKLMATEQKQAHTVASMQLTQARQQLQQEREENQRRTEDWDHEKKGLQDTISRLQLNLKTAEETASIDAESNERRVQGLLMEKAALQESHQEYVNRMQQRRHELELQLKDITHLLKQTQAEKEALQDLETKQGPLVTANIQLAMERSQLVEEKSRLVSQNTRLQEENKALAANVSKESQRILRENSAKQVVLVEANVRLANERSRLLEEKNRLGDDVERLRRENQQLHSMSRDVYGKENERLSGENERLSVLLDETNRMYEAKAAEMALQNETLILANAQLKRELSRQAIENRKWSEEMPKLVSENTRLRDQGTRQSLVDFKEGQWIVGEHENLNDAVSRLAQASARLIQENNQLADENTWLHDVTRRFDIRGLPASSLSAGLPDPSPGLPPGRQVQMFHSPLSTSFGEETMSRPGGPSEGYGLAPSPALREHQVRRGEAHLRPGPVELLCDQENLGNLIGSVELRATDMLPPLGLKAKEKGDTGCMAGLQGSSRSEGVKAAPEPMGHESVSETISEPIP